MSGDPARRRGLDDLATAGKVLGVVGGALVAAFGGYVKGEQSGQQQAPAAHVAPAAPAADPAPFQRAVDDLNLRMVGMEGRISKVEAYTEKIGAGLVENNGLIRDVVQPLGERMARIEGALGVEPLRGHLPRRRRAESP